MRKYTSFNKVLVTRVLCLLLLTNLFFVPNEQVFANKLQDEASKLDDAKFPELVLEKFLIEKGKLMVSLRAINNTNEVFTFYGYSVISSPFYELSYFGNHGWQNIIMGRCGFSADTIVLQPSQEFKFVVPFTNYVDENRTFKVGLYFHNYLTEESKTVWTPPLSLSTYLLNN